MNHDSSPGCLKVYLFHILQLLLFAGIGSLLGLRPPQALLFMVLSMLAFRFLFRLAIHLSARD